MEVIVVNKSLSVKSSWKSMEYISFEFEKIIKKLSILYDIKHITIDENYKIENNEIIKMSSHYCHVIYYTNAINFREAINWLKEYRPNATHNIAIFGNLLSNPRRIKEYLDLLVDHKVRFLFASEAYQNFARNLIDNLNSIVIPFSIGQSYNSGYSEKKWDFIYASRINSSKGIMTFINTFSKEEFSHFNVAIAGDFDETSYPLRGLQTNVVLFKGIFQKLPPNITYLGNLSHDELIDSFKSSACYICLSSFTSEDFGYASLQALYNGCDLILSHWGGLKQYKKYKQTKLVHLSERVGHYVVSEKNFEDIIRNYTSSMIERDIVQDYCRENILLYWKNLLRSVDTKLPQSSISALYSRYIKLYIDYNRKPFSSIKNQKIHRLIFQEFK